jgi:hypothetical protein
MTWTKWKFYFVMPMPWPKRTDPSYSRKFCGPVNYLVSWTTWLLRVVDFVHDLWGLQVYFYLSHNWHKSQHTLNKSWHCHKSHGCKPAMVSPLSTSYSTFSMPMPWPKRTDPSYSRKFCGPVNYLVSWTTCPIGIFA